ncbi:MAG: SUF system NifU family Fe-S cluster assembly protein [bacterium]
MINLDELYRQVIMDNYKNPKNKGLIHEPGYINIHLNNPSCGDDMNVSVKVENGIVTDLRHDGTGCSICCSSASVASVVLRNKELSKVKSLINEFYELVKGENITNEELDEALAYASVSKFPARIKCATLGWKAIEQALEESE